MRITFLGTAASRPTVGRNVSGLCVQREGDLMLFDCGEGTQRQMMRYGTGFGVQAIFITHLHADHFLGIVGLIRTMGLQGREDPLPIYGPPGAGEVLETAVHIGVERLPFPVPVQELEPGGQVPLGDYDIIAFQVRHGTSALGFALREHPRLGRFDVDRARALGIPEGRLFGQLHRGDPVEVDGRIIRPEEVVGDPRPGRLVVYTGDTRPSPETVGMAKGADLLVHEATFLEDESERAHETFHSTARGAAEVARKAGVRRLVLTHVSARYSEDPGPLAEEAKSVFPETSVAHDGLSIELGYPKSLDEEVPSGDGPGRG
ncbi:MAG: ribonuclease Z [Gemmatimonadetes bacterium]|nr:ribonuclease Z [Gemmatimonadota bacterium]